MTIAAKSKYSSATVCDNRNLDHNYANHYTTLDISIPIAKTTSSKWLELNDAKLDSATFENGFNELGRLQKRKSPARLHYITLSGNHNIFLRAFLVSYKNMPEILQWRFIPHFVSKLKEHIVLHIKMRLQEEISSAEYPEAPSNLPEIGLSFSGEDGCSQLECNSVFFKNDHMYKHQLVRFNYTTYDIRQSQDVIHPDSSHRDVMLLAEDPESNSYHPFLYARVLRVFHVNVIYTGAGSVDYRPQRLDVLWVCWFRYTGSTTVSWHDHKLDRLHFPPMASKDAFNFIDPKDVVWVSHYSCIFKRKSPL